MPPPPNLEFGNASADCEPDFGSVTIAYVCAEQQEWWGDLYPTIQSILRRPQSLAIFYTDPKPGNLRARGQPTLRNSLTG